MKTNGQGKIRFWLGLLLAVLFAGVAILSSGLFYTAKSIFDLLNENKELRGAIKNLTAESQIGYAKVLEQTTRGGKLYTRLKFVATDRGDPLKRVLEKDYEVEGDIVHFDVLIVTFDTQLVMDGRERSMYLLRRVYGETMPPELGYAIEAAGCESPRYTELCAKLSLEEKELFWKEVWALSNDPQRLQAAGIKAIYGNVVYQQLRPGLIYILRIGDTGNLYPDVVPVL